MVRGYALVPFHIGDERFASQGRDLAALSSRLARRVAASAAKPRVRRPGRPQWGPTFAARSRLELAACHSVAGAVDEARRLAGESLEVATKLGMVATASAARELLSQVTVQERPVKGSKTSR